MTTLKIFSCWVRGTDDYYPTAYIPATDETHARHLYRTIVQHGFTLEEISAYPETYTDETWAQSIKRACHCVGNDARIQYQLSRANQPVNNARATYHQERAAWLYGFARLFQDAG